MKRLFLIALMGLFFGCSKKNIKLEGNVFGTTYHIQYYSRNNHEYQQQFDSLFAEVNQSMSTYIPDSDISRLNRNENNQVDDHFIRVLQESEKIYKETSGVFDPTIGIVVNAWDFGPQGKIQNLDSLKIDSLMTFVGLDKVTIEGHIINKPLGTFIDFNAIAKGYGVDVIGEFLEKQGVKDYLVEIGGEIRCKGKNIEKNKPWKVGVEMPHFDGTQSIMKAISITNASMATSGTYRKFKTDENGNRYSHIIDTKNGYPSKTNLLSISVIADQCMTADAYATTFKAMGVEGVKTFLESHPELKVFLIFENDKGELETIVLNGFPED